ncbi:MAG: hypothetical protein RL238_1553, partial [Actinomycetota bacterium]
MQMAPVPGCGNATGDSSIYRN